jgi:hypothetical protein
MLFLLYLHESDVDDDLPVSSLRRPQRWVSDSASVGHC